ncbi:hypothetical protein [Brucella sp.]|uniref:hypothetical protein n=1 Tax=Brucella sp. TaxID=52132 RepID=UPI0028AF6E4B|nr:hypothetical protein [Brucella sp.]
MNQEIITQDGEVFEETTALASTSMAVQLQKAEIDQLVSTAHAFPRSLKRVQSNILGMATLDEESAEECIYALPRGGKPIRGPSIRFAEILKQSYGNCRAAARVVHVDKTEGYIEAEGVFHDLETNSASTARVRRRITDKNGRVFKDDMIIVTGNAACSIAMRNAILAGVPKPLWRKAYDMVQATITGDITTLSENREKAFKALAAFGVKPDQVFSALGVQGEEDITVDHIATLRGMYSALKNGEATVEEMFIGTVKAISDHAKIENPFSAEPATTQTNNVTPEPETPASGPDNSEQDTSADLTSTGSVEGGEPMVDQASTLDNSGDEPSEPNIELRKECWEKFIGAATNEANSLTERRGILETSKDAWKIELPNDLEFVRVAFMEADNVIKGKVTKEEATDHMSSFLGG